jgi:hypothetical protein
LPCHSRNPVHVLNSSVSVERRPLDISLLLKEEFSLKVSLFVHLLDLLLEILVLIGYRKLLLEAVEVLIG